MKPRALIPLILLVVVTACGRRTIRDHLDNPVRVVSAKADLLVLANGESRQVRGIEDLIRGCPTIGDGIEISADGTLFGLVPMNRYCGNDPIGFELQKMPIEPLIAFLRGDAVERDIAKRFGNGKLDVGAMYEFVRVCGGTWNPETGAAFPGE